MLSAQTVEKCMPSEQCPDVAAGFFVSTREQVAEHVLIYGIELLDLSVLSPKGDICGSL